MTSLFVGLLTRSGLVRLATFILVVAGLAEWWLQRRGGGPTPPPFRSMVVIDAPIDRVWRELADIEGQPRWMTEMRHVEITTPPPVGVGTRGEATVRILGISVTDPVVVTGFEPPDRFEIRHEGLFTGHGKITLEPGADGTTTIVRWDETLVAPILPRLWRLAAEPVVGPIFQADLGHLRDLVEAG